MNSNQLSRVPYAAVIIPAHNEAATINRCLESILNDPHRDELDVLVVANGCTDDTVDRAMAFGPPVRLIDRAEPSKAQSLDIALRSTADVTRIYIDADVVVSPGAITKIVEAIKMTSALAAAPSIVFDTTNSSWLTSLYLKTWAKSGYFEEGHVGTGLYAISSAGHRSIPNFAGLVADDLLPMQRFSREQRLTVAQATFTPLLPINLQDLIKVQVRQYNGAIELDQWLRGNHEEPLLPQLDRRWLYKLSRNPENWPGIVVYSIVRQIIRTLAFFNRRTGSNKWLRDESSRRSTATQALLPNRS